MFLAVAGQQRIRIARLENVLPHLAPTHELLWSFRSFPRYPTRGALVLASDGYYWGTSEEGGVSENGTVYRVSPDGSDWKVVAAFTGAGGLNPGETPSGGLVSDGVGNLWGTTERGGSFGAGTIFKVNEQTGEPHIGSQFYRKRCRESGTSTKRRSRPRRKWKSLGNHCVRGRTQWRHGVQG
jgi:uncharacterized repeat protein (TIGR03803 family)